MWYLHWKRISVPEIMDGIVRIKQFSNYETTISPLWLIRWFCDMRHPWTCHEEGRMSFQRHCFSEKSGFKYVQICLNMFKYVQICLNMFKYVFFNDKSFQYSWFRINPEDEGIEIVNSENISIGGGGGRNISLRHQDTVGGSRNVSLRHQDTELNHGEHSLLVPPQVWTFFI